MRDASVLGRALACVLATLCLGEPVLGAPEFKGYDIRVIRPRYFVRESRLDAGFGVTAIMNQSFIYSFLGTGILSYHFSESFAVEAQASYGKSFDRDEKRILVDEYEIHTVLLRTESLRNGRIVWTPSYGKYLLGGSEFVYFDTFVTAGLGKTGIRYRYDHCTEPTDSPPSERTVQYDTGIVGIGQRHFLSQTSSFRLGAEVQRFLVDQADGACRAGAPSAVKSQDNVVLFLGWSTLL